MKTTRKGKVLQDFINMFIFVVGVAGLLWYAVTHLETRETTADRLTPPTVAGVADEAAKAIAGLKVADAGSGAVASGKAASPGGGQAGQQAGNQVKSTQSAPASPPVAAVASAPAATTAAASAPARATNPAPSTPSAAPSSAAPQPSPQTATATAEFFAQLQLNREQSRGERVESLRQLLQGHGLDEEARKQANAELLWLSKAGNLERQAEDLISAQGIRPVVVTLLEEEKASVLVGLPQLSMQQAMQIAETVQQVAGILPENVRIVLSQGNGQATGS